MAKHMPPNLAPLLVPKTRTQFSHWLQQFVHKSDGIFGTKTLSRCHRVYAIARQWASGEGVHIGIARITTTVVTWLRRAPKHMRDGRCNTAYLMSCAHELSLKSRAYSHRVLGRAANGPESSSKCARRKYFLCDLQMRPLGPAGCAWGVVQAGGRDLPPARSASRVQRTMCLRTES